MVTFNALQNNIYVNAAARRAARLGVGTFLSQATLRTSPQFLVAIAAAPRWPPTDDGDESFAEGVRRAGSCDHRCSAAGGGTIRGGVGVNIGAAFAVGVIGLLPPPQPRPPPPPPHCKKRRKAVVKEAGQSK